jgi:hypothetical protein
MLVNRNRVAPRLGNDTPAHSQLVAAH